MVIRFVRISQVRSDAVEPHKARCRRTLRWVAMMAAAVVSAPTTSSCAAVGSGYSQNRKWADYCRSRSYMRMAHQTHLSRYHSYHRCLSFSHLVTSCICDVWPNTIQTRIVHWRTRCASSQVQHIGDQWLMFAAMYSSPFWKATSSM